MIITKRMIRAISLLLVASSAICVLSSPVDKDLGEAFIPVEIQADDQPQTGYTSTLIPSIPAETDTLSKTNDEGDEEGLASTVPSDEEQFPTPFPFLDEPEEASHYIPSPPSRGTLTPPNFDINKVPGITGTKEEEHTPIFVGRQACKCGVSGDRRYAQSNDTKVQGREQFNGTKIVGGEPAPIENYPWTVALLRRNWLGLVNDRPYCAGTLISNLYILTASHCVDGMSPRGIVAAMHEEDVTSNTESTSGTQRIEIAKIIMHPQYNRRTIDNDIALLRLAQPVELGKVMIPACLPANNDHSFENFTATAAGWGAVKESGSTSNILRKVDVPVIPNMDCNTKTKYKGKITDNMLCAGFEEGGKDSCQGDSGGPLTIENGERLTLIGVVSWGYGCARPNSPGVYTRVARYPEWIVENSKDAEWCLD